MFALVVYQGTIRQTTSPELHVICYVSVYSQVLIGHLHASADFIFHSFLAILKYMYWNVEFANIWKRVSFILWVNCPSKRHFAHPHYLSVVLTGVGGSVISYYYDNVVGLCFFNLEFAFYTTSESENTNFNMKNTALYEQNYRDVRLWWSVFVLWKLWWETTLEWWFLIRVSTIKNVYYWLIWLDSVAPFPFIILNIFLYRFSYEYDIWGKHGILSHLC